MIYSYMEINKQFAHEYSHNYTSDMDNQQKFSNSLRKLRSWKGISQKELGQKIGVWDTTISAWESTTLDRIPPKPMIDLLTTFFKKELEETGINLYEDAGHYSDIEISEIKKDIVPSMEEIALESTQALLNRISEIERKIDILVEAYKVDKGV